MLKISPGHLHVSISETVFRVKIAVSLCFPHLLYFSVNALRLCLAGSSHSLPRLASLPGSDTSCPFAPHRDSGSDIESLLSAEPGYDSVFTKVRLAVFTSCMLGGGGGRGSVGKRRLQDAQTGPTTGGFAASDSTY